jgi:hypothetical protein
VEDNIEWMISDFYCGANATLHSENITLDSEQCVVLHKADQDPNTFPWWKLHDTCCGVALAYDIVSRDSFNQMRGMYYDIRKNTRFKTPRIYLVGSNTDLEARSEVATSEGENLARELGLEDPFFEVSAKTGENIDDVIHNVVREIQEHRAQTPQTWMHWLFKSTK